MLIWGWKYHTAWIFAEQKFLLLALKTNEQLKHYAKQIFEKGVAMRNWQENRRLKNNHPLQSKW